jgi:RNA polymerase sigma factor (sigma-70 family)
LRAKPSSSYLGKRPKMTTEDMEQLRAWRASDRAAGEALFERHYAVVARFFHNKVLRPAEREDLIQDTFLACVESAERFRGCSSFRTYLLGIAANVWRNHYRELQGPRNHAALGSTSMEDVGQSPSELLADHEEERMLLMALRRLDMELQLLLELRYWERLKLHELAEVLGVSTARVKNQLRRGKLLLEQHLTELASSPQKLQSTLTELDGWAEALRRKLLRPERHEGRPCSTTT